MKQDQQQLSETSGVVRLDENVACDVCGRFGAYQLGDRKLCQECYTGCGSCCPEFGKNDLWTSQLP
ncbi:MAG TPA: hypothetical protein DCQ92_13930 [Verrucomicrobia subdivision 3 bacterium]|nr:hypothetical protein [Limisphaerales bacterium]